MRKNTIKKLIIINSIVVEILILFLCSSHVEKKMLKRTQLIKNEKLERKQRTKGKKQQVYEKLC